LEGLCSVEEKLAQQEELILLVEVLGQVRFEVAANQGGELVKPHSGEEDLEALAGDSKLAT
jgi:hypothetical protein